MGKGQQSFRLHMIESMDFTAEEPENAVEQYFLCFEKCFQCDLPNQIT